MRSFLNATTNSPYPEERPQPASRRTHGTNAAARATLAQGQELASRTHELVSFLVDVRGMTQVTAHWPRSATYHDACSGLRELGVKQQPRWLLASVDGLELAELPDAEVCCGF